MADGEGVGLQGSFVMQKSGPLPNWAWMGLGLGGALAYAAWKSSKKKKEDEASKDITSPNGVNNKKTGSANGITYAFVDADSTVNTQYAYPPGGGRPPGGPPKPPDPTPAPDGEYVNVVKWTRHNAPWNSTLYGIATKLWGDGDAWRAIWMAPQNKSVRDLRGDPESIQPGDKIWVPTAAAGAGQDNESGHHGHRNGSRGNHDDDDDRSHRREKSRHR